MKTTPIRNATDSEAIDEQYRAIASAMQSQINIFYCAILTALIAIAFLFLGLMLARIG